MDFIIAHAKDDARPFLEISIFGRRLLGLLDSGSSRTILGSLGWKFLEGVCPLELSDTTTCTVANGDSCEVLGRLAVPIRLCDRVKIVDVLVVPSLPHQIILGMDFWIQMGIVPDLFTDQWHFRQESNTEYPPIAAIQPRESLTKEQQKSLDEVIQEAFLKMGDRIGCTNMVEHVITTNSPPIKQRHYPISPAVQRQVNEELDQLLRDGIVEPSKSPWASPIVLVRKPTGNYRFCIDFRMVNQVTLRDSYPLPFVSATLDKLRDAKFLTTLDIKSAYFQIPLAEASRPITAFVVPNRGLYQFRRMPMGLHNACATWQRFIDRVIGVDLEQHCFAYLDDIIVCTPTYDKHLDVLREVLNRITAAGLTLNRDKCNFCQPELKYLGYVVNANGLLVDPEKIKAILQIPTPRNVKEVRRIIGLASWYRRFVPNFSTIVAPLCELTKKRKKFLWNESCAEALRAVKTMLVSAPIMTCPNYDLPFYVATDASDYGVAATLYQIYPEGEKVICYLSRSLTTNERKWSTTEKECVAVLFAVEKLRPYLEATHFVVVTDHYSLKWLNSIKDPVGRIARWAIRLQQYDFEIVHRKGKDNIVPDALSRAVPITAVEAPESYDRDKWYSAMKARVARDSLKYPLWRIQNDRLYKHVPGKYPILQKELENWKLVVPKPLRVEIIKNNHDPPTCGHTGIFKTTARVGERYYWPKMRNDIARYIRRCVTCLSTKPLQRRAAGLMLSAAPSTQRPWQVLSIDLVGPLPRSISGYCYIFSVQDIFSKYVLLFPLRAATANAVSKIIEDDVILVYGAPEKVILDNGVQFRSDQFRKVAGKYEIKLAFTALYHAQANSVERTHRVVKTMLSAYVNDNHRSWDRYLAKIACAIRSSRHEVTKLTPNFVMFGRELKLCGKEVAPLEDPGEDELDPAVRSVALREVFKEVVIRLKRASERSRHDYNLRHRDERFQVNQKVWRKNYRQSDAIRGITSKLAPKFLGPFTVKEVLSPWTYVLSDTNGRACGQWHAKDLKSHPPDEEEESDDEVPTAIARTSV